MYEETNVRTIKIVNRASLEKFYQVSVSVPTVGMKLLRRKFKRARDAEAYGRRVVERYGKLASVRHGG